MRPTGTFAPGGNQRGNNVSLMTSFSQQDGALHCEGVSLETIAQMHGTPTYVYSHTAIKDAFRSYQNAVGNHPHLICYAVKANSNLAILRTLASMGAGFDVVSVGELERVRAAGGDAGKVVFSGVGKTASEMRRALQAGIKCFNVESEAELRLLASVAEKMACIAPISIRVNPDVDAGTHPYISTGLRENKFGVDVKSARDLYRYAADTQFLQPVGIDCHIGSQILDIAPFITALCSLLGLIDGLAEDGISLDHLDLGGGLGVSYESAAPVVEDYVLALTEHISGRSLELLFEPGRSIVAMAGALLTEVLYLKPGDVRQFAVVDAAMNDLLRPSLYGAWQEIRAVKPRVGDAETWDIVGPVCETGDFLGKDRELVLEQGDLLAVMGAGAYGFSMASNYNSRPRPTEVLIKDNTVHVIGRRESITDLWRSEQIPPEIA